MGQWVTFLVGQRVMTVRDDEVDGIVRDALVSPLSGLRAPITAGMEHEGYRLPLVDLREHEARADVLLMPGGEAGVVVDGVLAVVDDEALELDDRLPDEPLPGYVQAVLRRSGGVAGRVLYIDLSALSGLHRPRA